MKKHSSKKTFLKILLILSLIAASVTILSFLIDMKNSSPDNVSINITQVGTISSDDLSRGEELMRDILLLMIMESSRFIFYLREFSITIQQVSLATA